MARHGYDDDDFDIVDADGWNKYDSYAMRRAPQQTSIHMTQQMTTKVAPARLDRPGFWPRWGLSWPESGIAVSSGYAGFRPWLLSTGPLCQGNAKTRVDERSMRNFALYLGFGCAGLCRDRNPG